MQGNSMEALTIIIVLAMIGLLCYWFYINRRGPDPGEKPEDEIPEDERKG